MYKRITLTNIHQHFFKWFALLTLVLCLTNCVSTPAEDQSRQSRESQYTAKKLAEDWRSAYGKKLLPPPQDNDIEYRRYTQDRRGYTGPTPPYRGPGQPKIFRQTPYPYYNPDADNNYAPQQQQAPDPYGNLPGDNDSEYYAPLFYDK